METGSGALDGVLAPVTKGGSWNSATRAAYPVLKQTVWNKFDPGYDGYWGAATASILWCEEGYSTSYYVAEWVNSLSNITFVALAILGIIQIRRNKLPTRFALANAGMLVIGIGSFLFHATLLYSFQLSDELPMVLTISLVTWILFADPPDQPQSRLTTLLAVLLALFNLAFFYAYLHFPNPLFHQLSFGAMQAISTARGVYLLYRTEPLATPHERAQTITARKLQGFGTGLFALAFVCWNIDNLACEYLTTTLKPQFGRLAFLLEGHAWWHVFSGLGVFYILAGVCFMVLREEPDYYQVEYALGFLPFVSRTAAGWKAVGGKEKEQ